MIHSTAIIEKGAKLADDVEVGTVPATITRIPHQKTFAHVVGVAAPIPEGGDDGQFLALGHDQVRRKVEVSSTW